MSGPWVLIALQNEMERETLSHALEYMEWNAIAVEDLAQAMVEAPKLEQPPMGLIVEEPVDDHGWITLFERWPNNWASIPKILVSQRPYVGVEVEVESGPANRNQNRWTIRNRPLHVFDIVKVLSDDRQE